MCLQIEKVLTIWTVSTSYLLLYTIYKGFECTFIYTLDPLIDQPPPHTNYTCRHKHNYILLTPLKPIIGIEHDNYSPDWPQV